MPNTALITGASSGIGTEFARYHARRGGDVILTARSADKLDALAQELRDAHGIATHVFALDLGAEGGADDLVARIEAAGLEVDILINNAGFGGQGRHIDRDLDEERAMIDLNVKALVTLTHHFGQRMAQRGGGKILNVGSTAGFMPGPLQAVYFATKAFVQSYSQAVDQELRAKGVTVTVLAPGYVETGFADRADLHGTGLVKGGGATPKSVAKHGYDAMRRGTLVSVNETLLGIVVNWIIPLVPRRQVLKMVHKMQKK
ncbi:SDR family oxidoreductase [Sulfitobacter sp. HNIBRBA3233]|uniref:SDR family NAD(P)-dependent oxidoreductase n=1 Tax=Sulfitobacter marinivivus TaxID=3158558 RepID=UPI0032DECAE2